MDQKFIAGIGNIYSDEILWTPGCGTDRTLGVARQEIRRLYRAIVETCTRPSSTAARRWPTSSTSTCSASRASTRSSTRSTTARASRAAVPGADRADKASGRSTFFCEPARCDEPGSAGVVG